jgi:predicted nucleic acid-binding protein
LKKITFIDAGVLIAAVRGNAELARRAFEVLDDDHNRSFASSTFICLEVLPKARFHKRVEEASFYEAFFARVGRWATPGAALLEDAFDLGAENGLSALDALHGAAALSTGATELITTEKHGRPLHRLKPIKVTTIHSD